MHSKLLNAMITSLCTASQSQREAPGQEQRASPRVEIAFPTVVRGKAYGGQRFEEQALLGNFSAGGSYLTLHAPLEPGRPIFVVVRILTSPLYRAAAPRVAARGVIVRTTADGAGQFSVAVRFTSHRFLAAQTI